MNKTVFYSWQSDRPNGTNRSVIETALERAAKALERDDSIEVTPVIDRDTSGVAGSPDIAGTIFSKIEAADVFVPDISLITPPDAVRPSPNPNVLLELGYAVKARGWDRIVMVMNTAYGGPPLLPFDLRGRRVVQYAVSESMAPGERTEARQMLERMLEKALRAVFEHQANTVGTVIAPPPLDELALRAIDAQAPDRVAAVRRFMASFVNDLSAIAPDVQLHVPNPDFHVFVAALDAATPLVATFGRLATRAAAMDDRVCLAALYRGLEGIAERFVLKGSGEFYHHQFEFWRFLGYELLVMLVACLIQADRWEALADLLDEHLILENTSRGGGRHSVPFSYLRQGLPLCHDEAGRKGRMSMSADVLKARHSAAPLNETVDFSAFMDADYFLFMRAEMPTESRGNFPDWAPETVVFMRQPPRYLVEAQRVGLARRIASAVKVDRPETLRDRLLERRGLATERFNRVGFADDPFEDDMDVIHKLGSRA